MCGAAVCSTFADYYNANFTDQACSGTSMDSPGPDGYTANFQPALAQAAHSGIPGAEAAWTKYETRNPKADYTSSPQWAVVPSVIRHVSADKDVTRQAAATLSLSASPNPFCGKTRLYVGGKTGVESVRITVYDLRGRLVGQGMTWEGEWTWNAAGVPAGLYIAKMTAGGRAVSRALVVLK
jgi:hypothetical protein